MYGDSTINFSASTKQTHNARIVIGSCSATIFLDMSPEELSPLNLATRQQAESRDKNVTSSGLSSCSRISSNIFNASSAIPWKLHAPSIAFKHFKSGFYSLRRVISPCFSIARCKECTSCRNVSSKSLFIRHRKTNSSMAFMLHN
ncbi:hypothetical protein V6N11_041006 [Hibiscus sabdariffa]|uniref:Uncharacterized protein n=1 Tax=Hibiscus sabdariffa TaxID=183260 RepID=A0ABR2RJJ9_9ROSI